ncbi:STAS domain-containing protein [Patescibacteria group bacterium]|nr:STAS domain-containing protein [Patescibacteria group bacterium]
MASDFSVNIIDSNNPAVKVLELKGEFDESVLESFREQIDPILNDSKITTMVFNLKDLEFINSKGIGFIVSIHTHLAKDGRSMVICDAQEAVMDVISLVGLTSIIPYHETCDAALSSL